MDTLDLNSIFGDEELDIKCSGCNHQFKVKFKLVMNDGDKVKCPSCSEDIAIVHDDETKKAISDSNQELKSLEDSFKNFGK